MKMKVKKTDIVFVDVNILRITFQCILCERETSYIHNKNTNNYSDM